MDEKLLQHVGYYGHIYEFVCGNSRTLDEITMTDAYKAMLPESKKVADGEYLYIIAAYDWSVTEPEAEFEFAVLDTVQMYSGHKAVVSIHVCDEAIYTHILIKKTPGLEWPGPKELPEFCTINHDTPSAVIEYCEAMRYLMY